MGFFNLFLFIIIFHVFVTTPIFSHSNNNNERSSSSISNFLDLAKSPEVFDWMVRIRRKIHEYPELLYEEFNTSEVIRTELDNLGISYKHPVAETGVIGYIGTGKAPFVALRADIDGLPIQEMVEWEHKSKVDEKMHACAHDAHTAMLLGAAKILKQHEHQIKGTVVLVFQPAEEGGAGAKKVLEAGVLDKVSAIFGLHLVPTLPLGHVASKPGPFMAGSGTFHATIHGRGGHAAMPHLSIDPLLAASSAVVNLQQLVSREADPLDPQVVTVANFHGDGAFNVIPDSVTIGGTFRAFSPESITRLKERIQQVITGVATVHRCTAEVDFLEEQKPFYPATINDQKLHEHFLEVAKNVVGNENVYETQPVTVSEDFAFYQEVIPGFFFMLGFKSLTSVEPLPMLHSPHFTVNEHAFPYGAALHASLATTFLLNLDDGGKCHDEL
ncbi:hypothetical protein HN51_053659 [Arachis hypogaea]|uniref:IAA-amino acid hydrolase ILR1-like 4 n=1 Tax=Arachis hypogaea TaxID=3818 RepID=UPI0007AF6388|nr:IAA-amino acid hydrolase ILR1-like 4 isoform X6 [Arachis ipaensis]XP_025680026.1 IAA-amino acid hydrolase ILR1-like 4 [Arachis hypogaea]